MSRALLVLLMATGCAGVARMRQVKQASDQLELGMDSAVVLSLLGRPDDTASGVCGELTRHGGWKCVSWFYCPDRRCLRVRFQHPLNDDSKLVVNQWGWIEQ